MAITLYAQNDQCLLQRVTARSLEQPEAQPTDEAVVTIHVREIDGGEIDGEFWPAPMQSLGDGRYGLAVPARAVPAIGVYGYTIRAEMPDGKRATQGGQLYVLAQHN